MSSSTNVRIELTPKAGFCVKSTTLAAAVLPPPPPTPSTVKSKSSANFLEPAPQPIPVPKGQKVFVNLAWDPNVPPPPEGSEDVIKRAMQGEDVDEANPSGWYVPIIVSNARQDKDKSGNLALVFDCIFNSTVKSRTLRDPEFKIFLVELSLQRIEAQTGLALSRNIGTPNIASKGKLLPRSVQIPASMVPALIGAPSSSSSSSKQAADPNPSTQTKTPGATPLIQEITSSTSPAPNERLAPNQRDTRAIADLTSTASNTGSSKTTSGGSGSSESMLPGLRGILKKPASASSSSTMMPKGTTAKPTVPSSTIAGQDIGISTARFDWSWAKDDTGRLRIDVRVPGLTLNLVQESMLDIEPNRILLSVPNRPILDIDVGLSDAEIVARVAAAYASSSSSSLSSSQKSKGQAQNDDDKKEEETMRTLKLKRQRDFEVDSADAEWKVGTGTVTIFV
ncbi:hypothetical protein CVT25_013099 [Psilocybe cyanescens]|uniref:PIH1 N-terminal domain-containing protein n=1 Tax=Psilocybe cyanescens TaxID=93625 RepID=A0A409XHP5_PSICY|nr:hypothetical protein CVT25_013099 [Psilocybe cyanescens]